jgi:hypothetical protein
MNPLHHPKFSEFGAHVNDRLCAGSVEYKDESMQRPAAALIGEIQQELEDVSAWAVILWLRLENLKASALAVEAPPPIVSEEPRPHMFPGGNIPLGGGGGCSTTMWADPANAPIVNSGVGCNMQASVITG